MSDFTLISVKPPDDEQQALHAMADRIGAVIERLGGITRAAAETHVPISTLGRYRSASSEPTALKLAKIADAGGVTVDWLITGREPSISEEMLFPRAKSEQGDLVMIPVLDVVASAGAGTINSPVGVNGHIPFSRRLLRQLGVAPEGVQCLEVSGDSNWPTIADGALVMVDCSRREISGDAIYVVSMGEEVRIKRVHKGIDGTITLISDNKEIYPPERISKSDVERLRIEGRVFWTGKKL